MAPAAVRAGQRSRQPGIAIYNMRQGEGIRYETLFRDETAGALDAANGKEYVRMLRRAMDLGGFHQVIFICHTPLISELADRILSVSGGCVSAAGIDGTERTSKCKRRTDQKVQAI
jgi:exonuclease SbcC